MAQCNIIISYMVSMFMFRYNIRAMSCDIYMLDIVGLL